MSKRKDFKSYCITNNKEYLLSEWNFNTNKVTPDDVSYGSNVVVDWVCRKCNGQWPDKIKNRSRGTGCPYCANKRVLAGYNDLLTKRPDLAKEWDFEKNYPLTPSDVIAGTSKSYYWICPKGHPPYHARVDNRNYKHSGCPVCSGNAHLKGINDFATLYPELLKDWDYAENTLSPSDYSRASGREVHWKCHICGHKWTSPLSRRTRQKEGCSKCNSRNHSSFPEMATYFYLKSVFADAINSYTDGDFQRLELDIYLPSQKVGIEYDGRAWHASETSKEREIKKYKLCKSNDIVLIRIREDGLSSIEGSYDYEIVSHYRSDDFSALDYVLNEICEKLRISINVDSKRDAKSIYSLFYTELEHNSFAVKYPDLAAEWDYDKNDGLTPNMFLPGAHIKVYWRCSNHHSFPAEIHSRVNGRQCPYCSNRKLLRGFNDLETRFPEISKEWDYEKNAPILPSDIMPGTDKSYYWHCPLNHSYRAKTNSRTGHDKTGCPYCSNKKVLVGFNDLNTVYPMLAKEWDYENNGSLLPTNVLPGSGKMVSWICQKHGPYKHTICNRTANGLGCRKCAEEKSRRRVLCVDQNKTYDSITAAAKSVGLSGTAIANCCQGKTKSAAGMTWKYV